MSVASQTILMADSAATARKQIMDEVGRDLERSRLRPVGNDVLIAIYDRAGKTTAGGLVMPQTHDEDKFQGKIGLVLKVGPMCSQEHNRDYDAWFGGEPPQPGDWVMFTHRDGIDFLLGKTTCKFVEWKFLRGLTDVHDLVF